SLQRLERLAGLSYPERATDVLKDFLDDFTPQEIQGCVTAAYTAKKFGEESITQLAKLGGETYMLELWHGPTCAFKDMALQLLPHLMTTSAQKTGEEATIVILVATSGDTGKAALEGFKDVPGTEIIVFYPEEGVSPMQKMQMATQEGENVSVAAIEGNFDDAQTGVKKIFTDPDMIQRLAKNRLVLSSANSINWGRLVPQVVYYVSAYCDLLADGEIQLGEKINVVVPTGNFGNILAAYYAKHMGVPIEKLICASNSNKVLTDFIATGTYDRNREFITTMSPSMDILISSNLERLLYHLFDGDDGAVRELMAQLSAKGSYTVPPAVREKMQAEFFGGFCSEEETARTIRDIFAEYSYLCDTHTAVAVNVSRQYREKTGDHTKTIIASTASPYKFPHSVLSALGAGAGDTDEFAAAAKLEQLTGCEIPSQLLALREKPVLFDRVCRKDALDSFVLGTLGITGC
ncbi:MAG: threonine synthase, partial [Oscillospiraceae bacterium]|nr:threonine synthase [Oscillospiraceae bacterium]